MSQQLILTGLAAFLFAAVHVFGPGLKFLRSTPRSIWLSLAGGVAVAYIFVQVLPELAALQGEFERARNAAYSGLSWLEAHSYLIALGGLAVFYGLHRLARGSARRQHAAGREALPSLGVFAIRLTSYAAYNLLIGYLLLHREETTARSLGIYATAMAFHFVVNDQGLREDHGAVYDSIGRWILAAAPLAGWVLGFAIAFPPLMIAAAFAFLMGGVVLNVMKEELPDDRESRFWAFAAGAAAYALLLIFTR